MRTIIDTMKTKSEIPRQEPYNPLEKRNIGESIVQALLDKEKETLPPSQFIGAGVYAIYYTGHDDLYFGKDRERPVYVGKAVPSGARKGNVGTFENQGLALYNRLKQHAESIDSTENLQLTDFKCRYLAVDDIWISLAEALLIERFQPVWNIAVDGFGNHDPGKGRYNQQKSSWDTIHPGRGWAKLLKPNALSEEAIKARIVSFMNKKI